jgi:hypothetical protein
LKKKTTEQFIQETKLVHGNKFDYSLVNYTGRNNKVKIKCLQHGIFEQTPAAHLNGQGCPKCKGEKTGKLKRSNTKEFVERARKVHSNVYNYSLVNYKNSKLKVKIICLIHGEFEQDPGSHLAGCGCPECGLKLHHSKSNTKKFVKDAKNIHGDIYDYSLVNYTNSWEKIKIKCLKHGIFEQFPANHLKGQGCPHCGLIKCSKNHSHSFKNFVNKANKIHDNKYQYFETNYINVTTKIKIKCPKHGVFEQMPYSHLNGIGCPVCHESKGEKIIRQYLIEHDIKFKSQYKFNNCKDKKVLPFDFYLPEYNICIEYQGKQHYEPVDNWGGEEGLKTVQKHDEIKKNYCTNNNIKLLEIKYSDNIYKLLASEKNIE